MILFSDDILKKLIIITIMMIIIIITNNNNNSLASRRREYNNREFTSLQNISLSYFKYFMIIPLCFYYTIWAKCPIRGLIWTDLK